MEDAKKILYVFMHVPKCGGSTFAEHLRLNFKAEETVCLYPLQRTHYPLPGYEFLRGQNAIRNYLELLPGAAKEAVKVICGHGVYYGVHEHFSRPARYITFLRNPVSRMLSDYNMGLYLFDLFKKGTINLAQRTTLNRRFLRPGSETMKSLEEWFDSTSTRTNHTVFFLSKRRSFDPPAIEEVTVSHLEEAKKLLERFYFVGLTENYEADASFLYGELAMRHFCKNRNVASRYFLPRHDTKIIEYIASKTRLDMALYDYAKTLNQAFKKKTRYFFFLSNRFRLKRFFSGFCNPRCCPQEERPASCEIHKLE